MLTFCQLIPFIRKKKLLTTNYSLDTTKNNRFIHSLKMELIWNSPKKNLYCSSWSVSWSHFDCFVCGARACQKDHSRLHTQCAERENRKKEKKRLNCLPFHQRWQRLEEWSKSYHTSRGESLSPATLKSIQVRSVTKKKFNISRNFWLSKKKRDNTQAHIVSSEKFEYPPTINTPWIWRVHFF